jgi:argininosuccinate lyase
MKGVIDTLKVNKKNAFNSANKSYGVSLDIAEQIVIKYHIPFRKVHKLVGALVQQAVKNENISLSQLSKQDLNKILNLLKIKIDVDDLMLIIKDTTPEKAILFRKSYGSPNPLQQNEMVNSIDKSLLFYSKAVSERKEMLHTAFNNLEKEVILNTFVEDKIK